MPVTYVNLYRVYVAASAGAAPLLADYRPHLRPLAWGINAGSRQAQWAVFQQDLSLEGLNTRLQNQAILADSNRQVEIWRVDTAGDRQERVFWGELCRATIDIRGGQQSHEAWLLHAEVLPQWHYGSMLRGQRQYNQYTDAEQLVAIDLEFNPEVDGKTIPNMLSSLDAGVTPFPYNVWFDPDSTHTVEAREFLAGVGGTNEPWTLRDIVHTLCQRANSSETYLKNPDDTALDEIFTDAPAVHNLLLRRNQWLPELLDQLLLPHGYNWYLKLVEVAGAPPTQELRLTFFERASGTGKTLLLQAPGTTYDEDSPASTLLDFRLAIDLTTVRNKTIVEGAIIEREITVPLYRGWPEAEDDGQDHTDNTVRAGRLFVANEAEDYTDLRPEITAGPELPGCVPTRRIIEEMLRTRGESEREPPRVEYSEDAGDTWNKFEPGGWVYLQNQIGFYVTAEAETDAILDECLDATVEWRITGTVRYDARLEVESDQTSNSPLTHTVPQVIEAGDRFFDRGWEVGASASAFPDELGADIRDDDDEATTYAADIAVHDRKAGVEAEALLSGIITTYHIGDLITKVEGREISLNANVLAHPAYPQIVGITWTNEAGRQTTRLRFDSYNQGGADTVIPPVTRRLT